LFYGDNGSGKTTLTSILRSLTQNDLETITHRQSIAQVNPGVPQPPQSAIIIQRNATAGDITHSFNPTRGWSVPFPDIEIFDIHFVNDNIYSGFEFNDAHKTQLHQFVIGAQGVAIQQQIEQNKTAKATSRQNKTQIENDLIQEVGNNLTP